MEQKRFDKKNLLVIAAVLVLIAVVAVVAATQKRELNPTLGTLAADSAAAPAATDAAAPAEAYLVVTVAGEMYDPIPLQGEESYTITRDNKVNVIAVTPGSVTMHSASCDNQDCVKQGTVTLDNREMRVLQNAIICLPNEVVLEIYTHEEIEALLLPKAGDAGEGSNE